MVIPLATEQSPNTSMAIQVQISSVDKNTPLFALWELFPTCQTSQVYKNKYQLSLFLSETYSATKAITSCQIQIMVEMATVLVSRSNILLFGFCMGDLLVATSYFHLLKQEEIPPEKFFLKPRSMQVLLCTKSK